MAARSGTRAEESRQIETGAPVIYLGAGLNISAEISVAHMSSASTFSHEWVFEKKNEGSTRHFCIIDGMSDRPSSQDNSRRNGKRADWQMLHHTTDQKSALWWCIKVQESIPKQTKHPAWLWNTRLLHAQDGNAGVRLFNGPLMSCCNAS